MLYPPRPIAALILSLSFCVAAAGSTSPQMPFAFAANRGQDAPAVRYTGKGPQFKAWFEDRGVILQKGEALPPAEPWLSMPNTGVW